MAAVGDRNEMHVLIILIGRRFSESPVGTPTGYAGLSNGASGRDSTRGPLSGNQDIRYPRCSKQGVTRVQVGCNNVEREGNAVSIIASDLLLAIQRINNSSIRCIAGPGMLSGALM